MSEQEKSQIKQMICMRTDLNMRKGKMIAQGAHASVGATDLAKMMTQAWHRQWLADGTAKICVRVESEEHLLQIRKAALDAYLPVHLVTDSGHTEFHGIPTITCLAIGPAPSSELDPITGDLKLL